MKCEKCNEKEATFFYSSNINGEKSRRHLCADCAREEGFGGALDYRPAMSFNSFFDDVFSDFFSPLPSFGSFGSAMHRIMAPSIPRLHLVIGTPETKTAAASKAEQDIPADAGEDVKRRRELEALKAQLESAVKDENFEKAIELRDKIRELEN